MLYYSFPIVLLLSSLNPVAQEAYSLYSPDSALRLEIKTRDKLSWHLYSGKELLTQSSSVDLQLGNQKRFSGNLTVSSHQYTRANKNITVPVPYRRKVITDNYTQLELIFKIGRAHV